MMPASRYPGQVIFLCVVCILICMLCATVQAQTPPTARYLLTEEQAREIVTKVVGDIKLSPRFPTYENGAKGLSDFRYDMYDYLDEDANYGWFISRWNKQVIEYVNYREWNDRSANVQLADQPPTSDGKAKIIEDADKLTKSYLPGYRLDKAVKRFIIKKDSKGWLEYIQHAPCGAIFEKNRIVFSINTHTNHVISFRYSPGLRKNDESLVPNISRETAISKAKKFLMSGVNHTKLLWCEYIPPMELETQRGFYYCIIEDALGVQRLIYRLGFLINDDTEFPTPEAFHRKYPNALPYGPLAQVSAMHVDVDARSGELLWGTDHFITSLNQWIPRPQVFVDTHQIYLSYLPQVIHREAYVRLDYLWGNPLWNGTLTTAADGSITVQYPEATLVVKKPDVTVRRKDAVVYTGKVVETPDGGIYVHYSVIPLLTGDTVKWDEVYQVLKVTTAPVGDNNGKH